MTATAFAPVPPPHEIELPHEIEPHQPIGVFDQLAPDPDWGIGPDRPQLRLVADRLITIESLESLTRRETPGASVEDHRRRRFLVLVAATVLVLALASLTSVSVLSFAPAATAPIDESAPTVVVVQPGDSYGAIATKLGVDEPARFAERLHAANGGAELVVGQRLVLDLDSFG